MTWSYNPQAITEEGVDRMRFELGDTTFAPPELTAALHDEEYEALISASPNWRRAKIKCLEAILMKFAHQTNFSIDGVSYSFADRRDWWKKLLDETIATSGVPTCDPRSLSGEAGGPPYFYEDMQRNPWRHDPWRK